MGQKYSWNFIYYTRYIGLAVKQNYSMYHMFNLAESILKIIILLLILLVTDTFQIEFSIEYMVTY